MSTEDDELKIQHGLLGRPESPALERTARLAIETAFAEVVSNRLLYQKVKIDLSDLPAALASAKAKTNSEQLSSLEDEVATRPWKLETRHLGDEAKHLSIFAAANVGGQPVGTPVHKMNIHFYVPSVQLHCSVCKGVRTFSALVASKQFSLEDPFPRASAKAAIEQVYTVYYRCEGCRKFIYSVLVRREGARLHLCGFAPRRVQTTTRSVPTALEAILIDATNSVAEGDLFAGFYHLRTLIEHFAKIRLGASTDSRERGEDLLERYYKDIPAKLGSTLPSLTTSYDTLSKHMHARTGTIEDFHRECTSVCDHIEGIVLLSKYASAD